MDKKGKTRETRLYHSLISVVTMVVIMFVSIVGFGLTPQVPLVFGCFVAGVVSFIIGYNWEEILEGMISGIVNSLEAILILLLIGMLVGSWIASGTVPALIYYGLKIVSPAIFLPATMIICMIVSLAIGAWGTVGTIGLAFMGIGLALKMPAPLVAGCVISGSYLGDVVSPLSDATNLTAAVVHGDVFAIVKKVLPVSVAVAVFSVICYAIVGTKYAGGEMGSDIPVLSESLASQFNISPVAIIPLAVMVLCIALKMPAIPSMFLGSVAGMIIAVFYQGSSIGDAFGYAFSGYVSETGNELIDNLLTAGGMEGMLESISIIIIAMSFGGLMKATKQMEVLVKPIIIRIKNLGSMNFITVLTCIFMNIILPDQYLGISMPGAMYADEYKKRGFSNIALSAGLLGAAITSPLIPWNTCGIYCMTFVSASPLEYAPYAFFCWMLPIATILVGFIGSRRKSEKA
ncbi:MAG: Na+/H+ antiporter NhaC family protein [Clostridia bacterium]|nr:Na+/H+ antiporter NhaC family protein [Clostridia bacterium]